MSEPMDLKKATWSVEHTAGNRAKTMFYYLQSGGHFFCNPNYLTDRKNYNTMLIIYTLKGKGKLVYKEHSYEISKNSGFFIDCNKPHRYGTLKNSWNFIWFHFNGGECKKYFEKFYENNGDPVFKVPENNIIPGNIKKIHQLLKNNDPELDIKGSCLIIEILTELLLYNKGKYSIPSPVNTVLSEIEDNYYKTISLDDLSKKTGTSKYHLSRLFKKHTGYSPHEYIINYRISQAKYLLKTTEKPVYEIAEKVGFNSSSHFIKLFRQETKTTPLKFRNYWR
ncbi:MAG: AraC family transcriptional regulator [Bacillota bacterium]